MFTLIKMILDLFKPSKTDITFEKLDAYSDTKSIKPIRTTITPDREKILATTLKRKGEFLFLERGTSIRATTRAIEALGLTTKKINSIKSIEDTVNYFDRVLNRSKGYTKGVEEIYRFTFFKEYYLVLKNGNCKVVVKEEVYQTIINAGYKVILSNFEGYSLPYAIANMDNQLVGSGVGAEVGIEIMTIAFRLTK